ncbi:MAG: mechanosensitive ion channel [Candidatus Eisenbacteria bacterium]|nr:mechanosensitive ion channel [Candidatus Eisenbacteria bacterium]
MLSDSTWEAIRLWLVTTGLRLFLILVLAWIASRILSFGIKRFRKEMSERHPGGEVAKRLDTLTGIMRAAGLVLIFTVAGMVVLSQLGVKLGPMIAAAGVGGLAIGFGAQSLVRDIISGFFILVEDQVRVGDIASINGQGGQVEAVTLRHIRLRDVSGNVHFFPNGGINTVANMTKGFSRYLADVGVAYRENPDEVMEIMRRVVDEMRQEEPWNEDILEPLEVWGVDKFADSAVVIRARIITKPIRQWAAGREFNRRLKKAFDEAGVEIPFPHRTVYWGEGKGGDPAVLHIQQRNGAGRSNGGEASKGGGEGQETGDGARGSKGD